MWREGQVRVLGANGLVGGHNRVRRRYALKEPRGLDCRNSHKGARDHRRKTSGCCNGRAAGDA